MASVEKVLDGLSKKINIGVEERAQIPTFSPNLNYVLGGGLELGHISQIYGPKNTGKTLISIQIFKHVQNLYPDKICVWVDVEKTSKKDFFAFNDVDMSPQRFAYLQAKAEHGHSDYLLLAIKDLAATGEVPLIVCDSLGALLSSSQSDAEIGNQRVGGASRNVFQLMSQLNLSIGKNTHILFLNHEYDNINSGYGQEKKLSRGGRGKDYFIVQDIHTQKMQPIVEKEFTNGAEWPRQTGTVVRLQTKRTKSAFVQLGREGEIPFRVSENEQGRQILVHDIISEIIEFGKEAGVFSDKEGKPSNPQTSQLYYNGKLLGAQKEKIISSLLAEDSLLQELHSKVMSVSTDNTLVLPSKYVKETSE